MARDDTVRERGPEQPLRNRSTNPRTKGPTPAAASASLASDAVAREGDDGHE